MYYKQVLAEKLMAEPRKEEGKKRQENQQEEDKASSCAKTFGQELESRKEGELTV